MKTCAGKNMLSELCVKKIDRLSHTRELFKECKVLNVYQVNIWKNLVFMHQVNSNTVPNFE